MNIQRTITLVNLILLTAGAYLIAGFFYQVMGMRFESRQETANDQPAAALSRRMESRSVQYYNPIMDRDLFKTQKTPQVPETAKNVDVDDLQETTLKLKLWGTVSGDPQKAYAVIEDTQKREQNLFRVGDSIQNAQVKMILREKVVLTVAGEDEVLAMEKLQTGSSRVSRGFASRAAVRTPSPATGSEAPVRTQRISLRRDMINDAMQDVTKLMTEIAVRPHLEDGQPAGLALTNIKPNSVFRRMGLRNGDVLVGVGGQEIRSVDDALQLYEQLKSADDVAVQLKRRGRDQTINYSIR
jgi:general secretion pathway protein C